MMFCFVSQHHVWPVWSWLELCVRGSFLIFPAFLTRVFLFSSSFHSFFFFVGLFFMWLSTWYFDILPFCFVFSLFFCALSGPNSINFFSIETAFILRNKVNLTSTQSPNNVVNNIIFYFIIFFFVVCKIFLSNVLIFFIGFDWFYCCQSMLIWLYIKFNWIQCGKAAKKQNRFDVCCLFDLFFCRCAKGVLEYSYI